MQYEIVNLKENTVAGLTIRTKNSDPNTVQNLPDGLDVKTISAGKYAKFAVQGDTQAVGVF